MPNIIDMIYLTAAYQTEGLYNAAQSGVRNALIPTSAPSSVTPRMSSVIRTTYGKIAVKYATFPELFTPLMREK